MRIIDKLPKTPKFNETIVVIKENPDTNIIISGGINPNYKENSQETELVKNLYVAGGKRNWHDALTIPEAEIIQKELNNIGIQKSLLLETTSTNSKENFQNASELGYYKEVKHLTILTTKENTLRAKLTAQQNLPQFKESQISLSEKQLINLENIIKSLNEYQK